MTEGRERERETKRALLISVAHLSVSQRKEEENVLNSAKVGWTFGRWWAEGSWSVGSGMACLLAWNGDLQRAEREGSTLADVIGVILKLFL